jgi:agmatine deiminase
MASNNGSRSKQPGGAKLNPASATPRALGYRMPAEWEPHAATWLAWPHNASDWPGKFQPIPWVYASIVWHLAQVEQVHILVDGAAGKQRAVAQLARAGVRIEQVRFHRWPTNRVWTRDSGPIFVVRKDSGAKKQAIPDLALTDWKFNAWTKYDDWQYDDKIPSRAAKLLGCPSWTPRWPSQERVVLEGGSIDVNGAGVLLTTEECLLSEIQQRNPPGKTGLGPEQTELRRGSEQIELRRGLEKVFLEFLGVDQVLWLNRGIAGDDTHGHVDDIVRFVSADTIVAVREPNRADENHVPLEENWERLHAARNRGGKPFRVVELPTPAPVVFDGQRLPASYANFYIANGLVLVPTFNDPNDRLALNTLAGLFPERKIVGIHCGDLIWGLGALHCMTQQQPA